MTMDNPEVPGSIEGRPIQRRDDVIERLIGCYLERRDSEAERFVDVVHRIGIQPFKERVYGNAHQGPSRRQREPALA